VGARSGEPVVAADADSERRHSGQRDEIGQPVGGTAAGRYDTSDAPEGFIWQVGDRDYTAAIKAWEIITGRSAPLPAIPNRRGDWRLNPRFSEWMMGLPDGWVTAVPGLSRAAQLRIIGNGLVPAQGALALEILTGRAATDQYDESG
jgi:DNA (cytosine-5)-methyltransferase 1